MNNNILLDAPNPYFEAHLLRKSSLPFIMHKDTIRRQTEFNIHENLELLLFLEGDGYVIYDGERYCVQSGDLIAVNSYAAHQVISSGRLIQFCLIIDRAFCRYHNIDPNTLQFQHIIRGDARANDLFQRVMDTTSAEEDPFRSAAIKCAVLELLIYICRHYSAPKSEQQVSRDSASEYIHQAMGYMKRNLSQKLSADVVAASVGLSKFHFLREFKRITGYTMTHYLNMLRCEYARNLLESGQYNVKGAAYLCGFTNHSYFSSVFLKYTGLLPSQVQPSISLQQGGTTNASTRPD